MRRELDERLRAYADAQGMSLYAAVSLLVERALDSVDRTSLNGVQMTVESAKAPAVPAARAVVS